MAQVQPGTLIKKLDDALPIKSASSFRLKKIMENVKRKKLSETS